MFLKASLVPKLWANNTKLGLAKRTSSGTVFSSFIFPTFNHFRPFLVTFANLENLSCPFIAGNIWRPNFEGQTPNLRPLMQKIGQVINNLFLEYWPNIVKENRFGAHRGGLLGTGLISFSSEDARHPSRAQCAVRRLFA